MHPTEVYWLIDAKRQTKSFGKMGLTEDEAGELIEDMPMLETL